MKKRWITLTAAVLVCALLVLPFGVMSASAMTQTEFNDLISAQQRAYPNGSVCRSTQFGRSCFGWAYLIGYRVFGSSPHQWKTSFSLGSVKPGDIIQYGNTTGAGHTVFVTAVSGDIIYYADCNGNGNRTAAGQYQRGLCMVKWDNCTTISARSLFGYRFSYIKSAPESVSGRGAPQTFAGSPAAAEPSESGGTNTGSAADKLETLPVRFLAFSPMKIDSGLCEADGSEPARKCFTAEEETRKQLETYHTHALLLLLN